MAVNALFNQNLGKLRSRSQHGDQLASVLVEMFDELAARGVVSPFVNSGVIPSARLKIATIPTNTNTVVIGGHTFTFVTTLGAAASNTQIEIGTAAQARTDLRDAINGTANARVVQAITPFAGLIVADAPVDTDKVRIRAAKTRGGAAVAKAKADANIAVSETLADAADVWNCANLNEQGNAVGVEASCISKLTITTAMITAGKVAVELPFTPDSFVPYCLTSTGATRAFSDTIAIVGNSLLITLGGGASPNMQDGDVLTIFAST
jgi:hypothetical protein